MPPRPPGSRTEALHKPRAEHSRSRREERPVWLRGDGGFGRSPFLGGRVPSVPMHRRSCSPLGPAKPSSAESREGCALWMGIWVHSRRTQRQGFSYVTALRAGTPKAACTCGRLPCLVCGSPSPCTRLHGVPQGAGQRQLLQAIPDVWVWAAASCHWDLRPVGPVDWVGRPGRREPAGGQQCRWG